MAASITILKSDIGGDTAGRDMCVIQGSGNLGNPYATGGILLGTVLINAALAASGPAGATISDVLHIQVTSENSTYYYRHVAASDKILAYVDATRAEAGAIDLSAELLHFTIIALK